MVIREILCYLIEHPDAKDSLQGILHWWLPKGRGEWEVQEALDRLVVKGWLTQRQTTSSHRIYGLNKEKLDEITEFLRALEDKAEE